MLDKLRIEFTRGRPRHSNDNGLTETKNGAVVRRVLGYAHIQRRHANCFDTFCREYLNPFLNFHRPCPFATELADPEKPGRIKRVYRPRDAMTPLDKLASLPDAATFLREGQSLAQLQQLARALSDVQAAEELNEARQALFGLARAVGADQRQPRTALDAERDMVGGLQAAEAAAQIFSAQHGVAHHAPFLNQVHGRISRPRPTHISSTRKRPIQKVQYCGVTAASRSCSTLKAMAPTSPPHSQPAPPMISASITTALRWNSSTSSDAKPVVCASSAPAASAMVPLRV